MKRRVPHWWTYYTKPQLVSVLVAWGHAGVVPMGTSYIRLEFPGEVLDVGSVRRTEKKSTEGKRLYRVDLWSSAQLAQARQQLKESQSCGASGP